MKTCIENLSIVYYQRLYRETKDTAQNSKCLLSLFFFKNNLFISNLALFMNFGQQKNRESKDCKAYHIYIYKHFGSFFVYVR